MKKKIIYGLLFAVAMVTASSSFVSCKDYEGDDAARFDDEVYSLEDLLDKQKTALQNCSTNCANQHTLLWAEFQKYQKVGDYATNAKVKQDSIDLATAIQKNASAILIIQNALNNYVTKDKFTTDSTEFMRLINANTLAITAAQALAQNAFDLATRDSMRIDTLKTNVTTLQNNYTTLNSNFEKFYKAWGSDLDKAVTEAARVRALADTVHLQRGIWDQAAVDAKAALDSAKLANDTINFYKATWNLAAVNAKYAVDTLNAYKDKWTAAADTVSKYEAAWNKAVLIADSAWNFVKGTKFNNLNELIKAYEDADEALQDQIDTLKNDVKALKEEIEKIESAMKKEVTGVEIQGTYNPVFGYFTLPVGVQSNILATYYGNFSDGVKFPAGDGDDKGMWLGEIAKATSAEIFTPKNGFYEAGAGVAFNELDGNAGKLYLTINPTNVDFEGKKFTLNTSDGNEYYIKVNNVKASNTVLKWGLTRAASNGFYEADATIAKGDLTKASLKFDMDQIKTAAKDVVSNWKTPGSIDKSALYAAVFNNIQQDVPRLALHTTWTDPMTGEEKSFVSKYDIAAVTVAPLSFDFLYGNDDVLSKHVVNVKNTVDGKLHAIDNELKTLLVFKLGLNVPKDGISIQLNPGSTTFDVVATKAIPYSISPIKIGDGEGETKIGTTITGAPGVTYSFDYKYDEEGKIIMKNVQDEEGIWRKVPEITGSVSVNLDNIGVSVSGTFDPQINYYPVGTVLATVNIKSFVDNTQSSINSSLTGLNATLKSIDNLQDNIDKKLAQVSSTISGYLSRMMDINEKLFGGLAKILYNPNRYFQPALFATQDASDIVNLSTDYTAPSKIEGGKQVALFPTTFTGELGVPAFKKYIAVTQVLGTTAVTAEEINAEVEQFNRVLEGAAFGQAHPFYFTPSDKLKGATVEVLYEALDYHGKVAGKKFYFTVY